jgi:hypothetical protein
MDQRQVRQSLAWPARLPSPLLERTRRFERAFDDGLGVYTQPVLPYGGVQTAEVCDESEVTQSVVAMVFSLHGPLFGAPQERVAIVEGCTTDTLV